MLLVGYISVLHILYSVGNTGSGENDVAVVIALILDIGVSAVGVIGGVVNQIKVSRQKMVSCFVSTLDTW